MAVHAEVRQAEDLDVAVVPEIGGRVDVGGDAGHRRGRRKGVERNRGGAELEVHPAVPWVKAFGEVLHIDRVSPVKQGSGIGSRAASSGKIDKRSPGVARARGTGCTRDVRTRRR